MAETWLINESFRMATFIDVNISFTSNNQTFSRFATNTSGFSVNKLYYDNTEVWNLMDEWFVLDQAYRTVTFETSPTGDLLSWLQSNAVKQEEPTGTTNIYIGDSVLQDIYIGDTKILKVYAGSTVLWDKSEPQGETWVINEDPIPYGTMSLVTEISFVSNNNTYNIFDINSRGSWHAGGGLYYNTTKVFDGEEAVWTDQAYRTVTFETSPTGALLTWLQSNAVKQ